jgi:hypothetical protein
LAGETGLQTSSGGGYRLLLSKPLGSLHWALIRWELQREKSSSPQPSNNQQAALAFLKFFAVSWCARQQQKKSKDRRYTGFKVRIVSIIRVNLS